MLEKKKKKRKRMMVMQMIECAEDLQDSNKKQE